MNHEPAQRFGEYLKGLRKERKLGVRELARKAGINDGNLTRLENGERSTPQPNTLTALAAALNVPLADMFTMAGYIVPYDLPSMSPYLHARYGHLPEHAITSIDNYLRQLIAEHGMDPNGPIDLEDEYSESSQP